MLELSRYAALFLRKAKDMSLQFVFGSSGSGKTEYMYQRIVEEAGKYPKKNFLVIVPEQFTMQTQRKLVDLSANGAIMNIDVLSFKRLAYRVFDELGIKDIEILEETGKNLVLRKIAQEKEPELTVLRPNMSRMGYISELKSLLSEFVQYNITVDQLREYIKKEHLSAAFCAKLSDVIVMYEGFHAFMQERYITAEELLNVLSRVACQSEILRGSVLVFDEFTGFTPIQKQLLYQLFPIVEKVWVSLTIDDREDFYHSNGMQEIFDLSKKTIQALMQIASDLQVEVEEPIVLKDNEKKRYKEAPALAFMEKNLFRIKSNVMKEEVQEIQISSVKSPKDELIYVARTIQQLIQEGGYRYRDIAIVTGAVENYANYMQTVFGTYQIPYFIDTTKEILFHPFIEWIRSTLEIVRLDFSYETILRFLRCGFTKLSDNEIDILENYLLATGIRGKKVWEKRWLRVPKGMNKEALEPLNQMREYLCDLLIPFADIFKEQGHSVKSEIIALYELTVKMQIELQLWEKEQFYLEQDQQVKAKEYGQIYKIVMELLDKYVSILGDETLSIQEFVEVLDAGLDAAEVATIPPGYDCVTIGDIERTRLNQIKVLFFVGVNDGVIPKSINQGGIISQYERELLKENDLELAPSAREQSFIQRFYLYLNLTKPSNALYISYTKIDSDGKAVRPSYLISTIKRMFPSIVCQELGDIKKLFDVSTLQSTKEYLIYGEKDNNWYTLAKWFAKFQKKELEKLLEASYIRYVDDPISKNVAQAIYGTSIEGSVTRFEQFAQCAYAHFLKYGLLLRERQVNGFANVDIGNIYHDALYRYGRKVAEAKESWFTISDEVRAELTNISFEEAIESYSDLSIYTTAENKHMIERMRHVFEQTVWALTMQVRKGTFVPEIFEYTFKNNGNSDELHFVMNNKETVDLIGRVDRIDTCQEAEDGSLYVKIIDYKSGNNKFDMLKLYQGLQLQLVVYMNAAMEHEKNVHDKKKVIPGGILYYHIDDPIIEVTGEVTEQEMNQRILEELKPDGLINEEEAAYRAMDAVFETKSDVIPVTLKKNGELSSVSHTISTEEFEVIGEYAKNQIQSAAQDIFDGKISINPYQEAATNSCAYCSYASVCQIYSKIPGMSMRKSKGGKKEEILEQMRTVNAQAKSKKEKGE